MWVLQKGRRSGQETQTGWGAAGSMAAVSPLVSYCHTWPSKAQAGLLPFLVNPPKLQLQASGSHRAGAWGNLQRQGPTLKASGEEPAGLSPNCPDMHCLHRVLPCLLPSMTSQDSVSPRELRDCCQPKIKERMGEWTADHRNVRVFSLTYLTSTNSPNTFSATTHIGKWLYAALNSTKQAFQHFWAPPRCQQ